MWQRTYKDQFICNIKLESLAIRNTNKIALSCLNYTQRLDHHLLEISKLMHQMPFLKYIKHDHYMEQKNNEIMCKESARHNYWQLKIVAAKHQLQYERHTRSDYFIQKKQTSCYLEYQILCENCIITQSLLIQDTKYKAPSSV